MSIDKQQTYRGDGFTILFVASFGKENPSLSTQGTTIERSCCSGIIANKRISHLFNNVFFFHKVVCVFKMF